MTDSLNLNPDLMIRAGLFAILLVLIVLSERLAPRRRLQGPRTVRWLSNLTLGGLNILILRFGFPMLGYTLAVLATDRGWGVFHWLELSFPPNLVFSLLALDLVIWAQHRFFHWQPLLWRLHRMHHTDTDFDVTTAVRFHPLEAILSLLIKSAVILALGVSPVAFLVFEIVLSSTSLFNHGNFRLPLPVDRWLRWLVVTPDMHRVHHSVVESEMNSNFGFNLPWWDRLFGTYRDQPALGHQGMTIGLNQFREGEEQRLTRLLVQPFRAEKA